MPGPLIEVSHLEKTYRLGPGVDVPVLKDVSLTIEEGEFVAVMGHSGSGKSTFMNILGTLDRPTSGNYRLNGVDVNRLPEPALAVLRNRYIGFIFQGFNLIPGRTALDNVSMPLVYAGRPRPQCLAMASSYLEMVGMADYAQRLPNQLSGGQQQRVAAARALVHSPKLILADEPTGNLDSKAARELMNLLATINQSRITVVLVTHDLKIAGHAQRVLYFQNGELLDG